MTKKYTWHKIAETLLDISFSTNGIAEITVAGKTMCIVLKNDTLLACANKCPHAGGLLTNGYVDATGNIVCPLHRYKFNLQTGNNTSGEGYFLKTYPIERRPEGIFVGITAAGIFNW